MKVALCSCDALKDGKIMFFQFFELVVQNLKSLLSIGDVGCGGGKFVGP